MSDSLENSNHVSDSLFDEVERSSNRNPKTKKVISSSSLSSEQLISRFRPCPEPVRKNVCSLTNSASCKRFVVNYSLKQEEIEDHREEKPSPLSSKKRDDFSQKQPVKNNFVGGASGGISTSNSTETATTARGTPRTTTVSETSENKVNFNNPASPVVVAASSPRNNNNIPNSSPEFRIIASEHQKNQLLLSLLHVQKMLHALEYNFLPITSFFDLRKRRSVRAIFETAKEMLTCSLPIRCLEAVFLSLYLTVNLSQVTRFPISMTSCGLLSTSPSAIDGDVANNVLTRTKYFKHIVLGIRVAIAKNGNDSNNNFDDECNNNHNNIQSAFSSPKTNTLLSFGTLGLSRRSCLMDKSLFNPEYSNCLTDLLLKEFATSYNSVGHRLVSIRLGLPFPHDTFARNIPCWVFLELFSIPPHKMIENTKKSHSVSNNNNQGAEIILAKVEEENRQVLQIFQGMMNALASDYLKFIEMFPESRGSCVRVLEKRATNNNLTLMMGGIKVNRYGIPVSNESSSSTSSSSPLSPPIEASNKDKNSGNPIASPRLTPKTKQNDKNNKDFSSSKNPNSYPSSSPTSPSHHRNADTDVLGREILEAIHTKYFSPHPLHTRQHQESRKLLKIILELCDEHQKQIPSYDDGGEGDEIGDNNNALEQDEDEQDDDGDEQKGKNKDENDDKNDTSVSKQCKKKSTQISTESKNDDDEENPRNSCNNISMEQLQKSFKENRFRIECLLRGVSPYKVAMGMPLPSKKASQRTGTSTATSAGGVIPKPPSSSSSSWTASPRQQRQELRVVATENENENVTSSFPSIDAIWPEKHETRKKRSPTSSRSGSSNSIASSTSTSPCSNSSTSSSSPTASAKNHQLPFLPPIHRNNNNNNHTSLPPSSAASSSSTCAKQNQNTNNTFSVTSSRQPTPMMMPKNSGINSNINSNNNNYQDSESTPPPTTTMISSCVRRRMKILEGLGKNNDDDNEEQEREEGSTYHDDFETCGEIQEEKKTKEAKKKSKKSKKTKKSSKKDSDDDDDDDELSQTPERKMATLMPRKSI